MSDQRCIVTSRHEPEKTPRALDGLLVCRGHRHKIERMIAELPSLYDDLGLALTAAERRDADQGKAKNGATGKGLNLNEKMIEAREEIHNELVRLVRHVSEERGFTAPRDTVPALATWLTVQVEWLCAQPDADETHDYLDRLSRITYAPSGRRRFVLPDVMCGVPLYCELETRRIVHCDGRLVAYLMPNDDRENLSEITCDLCEVEVPLVAAAMTDRWKDRLAS